MANSIKRVSRSFLEDIEGSAPLSISVFVYRDKVGISLSSDMEAAVRERNYLANSLLHALKTARETGFEANLGQVHMHDVLDCGQVRRVLLVGMGIYSPWLRVNRNKAIGLLILERINEFRMAISCLVDMAECLNVRKLSLVIPSARIAGWEAALLVGRVSRWGRPEPDMDRHRQLKAAPVLEEIELLIFDTPPPPLYAQPSPDSETNYEACELLIAVISVLCFQIAKQHDQ